MKDTLDEVFMLLWIAMFLACNAPKDPGVGPVDVPLDPEDSASDTDAIPPIETGAPDPTVDEATLALDPLRAVNNGRFATSPVCAECHANSPSAQAMRDDADRPIGMFDLWQASMMANAGRDPLWRAAVSAEIAATPAAGATIQAKCARCHLPMASADAALAGDPPPGLPTLTEGGERQDLALDGVSCTVCHQIEPLGLGTDASMSGGYTLLGQGRIYGPHADPFTNPMVMHTGFTPVEGAHVLRSELCATCHQQEVHTLAEDGSETGSVVPEQSVYAEWQNSAAFAEGKTCQTCHLPVVDEDGVPIETAIAREPQGGDFMGMRVGPRRPYGRHVLVGGNTLVPQILRDASATLAPQAPTAAFDATVALARRQLAEATASLSVVDGSLAEGVVAFTVEVMPLTGHKFPTGIPVRRAWLHVTVVDASGVPVFESGGWDGDGRIVGADGVPLASEFAGGPVEPHREVVTSDDAAQIYEPILADADGAPEWRLTRGARWLKDNRVLPRGWDPAHPEMDWMAPAGVGNDPDYEGPGDRVRYEVVGVQGPVRVEAELVFQPLSTRWAEELFATDTPEARAFEQMWQAADRNPERVASAEVEIP